MHPHRVQGLDHSIIITYMQTSMHSGRNNFIPSEIHRILCAMVIMHEQSLNALPQPNQNRIGRILSMHQQSLNEYAQDFIVEWKEFWMRPTKQPILKLVDKYVWE